MTWHFWLQNLLKTLRESSTSRTQVLLFLLGARNTEGTNAMRLSQKQTGAYPLFWVKLSSFPHTSTAFTHKSFLGRSEGWTCPPAASSAPLSVSILQTMWKDANSQAEQKERVLRTHKSELAGAEPGASWNRGMPGSTAGGSKHSAQWQTPLRGAGSCKLSYRPKSALYGKKGRQETDCQEPEVLQEVCVGSGLMQGQTLGSGKLHCFPEFLCHSKQSLQPSTSWGWMYH